jgi:hypothetical protein
MVIIVSAFLLWYLILLTGAGDVSDEDDTTAAVESDEFEGDGINDVEDEDEDEGEDDHEDEDEDEDEHDDDGVDDDDDDDINGCAIFDFGRRGNGIDNCLCLGCLDADFFVVEGGMISTSSDGVAICEDEEEGSDMPQPQVQLEICVKMKMERKTKWVQFFFYFFRMQSTWIHI